MVKSTNISQTIPLDPTVTNITTNYTSGSDESNGKNKNIVSQNGIMLTTSESEMRARVNEWSVGVNE
jgi:hypothetical protein